MDKFAFAIYDSKAEHFYDPMFRRSKGDALRDFITIANDDKTKIGLNPEDFTLFYLGRYNDLTGKFENNMTPESMGLALELKQTKE